ncbi:MAG: phage minor capsid protein, partial [Eubacterium sp.]
EESEQSGYPLVSEAIEAGLLHPNCRHHLATYFPGVTKLPEIPDDDIIKENYKVEQEQRRIEREIRYWKRIQAGSMDPEQFTKAGNKVKYWQSRMREHLEENPQLRRQYSREKDRLTGTDTLKTKKEALLPEIGKVEEGALKQYISSDAYKINEALRNGETLSVSEQNLINHLDAALDKLPKYRGNLTRSLKFYSQEAFT